MNKGTTEKFFCNVCKRKTNHFIRGEHNKNETDNSDGTSFYQRLLIAECCGCEHLALIKKTHFSEHVEIVDHPVTGETTTTEHWEEFIYPPL